MVKDPHLVKHLAHFGIKVADMEKTDKSMAELEIDLNQNMEFSAITEAGSKLEPAYGRGLTGMENLGNTCYMNSIMQVRNCYNLACSFFLKVLQFSLQISFYLVACKVFPFEGTLFNV